MAKINLLDSSVYNLIAAGEVVERPASVVKELVENSIDAGAKNIKVEIWDGGIKQIKVTDDGCGIEKDYLVNAFLPHATSKIETASDLDNILSLGFRGEALASIAAVSNVTLTSKVKDDELGNCICLSAGKITSQNATGATDGTIICVQDLFFNVPVRAKFLKKPKSEEQEITNIMERFILANPNLNFIYIADGKQVLSSLGSTLKDAMYAVYGKSVLTETLYISLDKEDIKLSGYIGRPSYSKPNRTYQTIVINGRYIVNNTIVTAVTNAYGEMLMKRKYPFFVINLTIDPKSVDVNVHPNKLDVRFENNGRIFSIVYEAVSRALSEMDYVLEVDTSTGEVKKLDSANMITTTTHQLNNSNVNSNYISNNKLSSVSVTKSANIDKAGVNLNPFANVENTDDKNKDKIAQQIITSSIKMASSESKAADNFGLGSKLLEKLASTNSKQQSIDTSEYNSLAVKIVGKLFNTYVLVEYGSNMYMIDQHAAHERILYEQFKKQVDSSKIIVQPLMFPYVLTVNSAEYNMIESSLTEMRSLGFDIDEFGDNTFKVSAVPLMLIGLNFDEFFANFLTDSKSSIISKQSELIKEKLMQHSCKSAVKGGNDLTKNEIENLFKNMNDEKIPLFCPHGRPIAVRVTKAEIEKWFKRIV